MPVIFKNPGLIDMAALRTFGVSVKDTNNPIGMFGTGLKYAIAVMLRDNIKFEIYRGKDFVHVETREFEFRHEKLQMVVIDGQDAGFTTHFGKNWKAEHAFRELYSNCLDERGKIYEAAIPEEPKDNWTNIFVYGTEFTDLFFRSNEMFLQTAPVFSNGMVEIRGDINGVTSLHKNIYYRGVKAKETNKHCICVWNILAKMELTEDRTLKHDFLWKELIVDFITMSDNADFIKLMITAPNGSMEADLDFDEGPFNIRNPSQTFLDCVGQLKGDYDRNLNHSAYKLWLKKSKEILRPETALKLDKIDQSTLDEAIAMCQAMGFMVTDYPILIQEYLGERVMGMAKDGKILISRLTINQGKERIASTLLEEYFHLKHKFSDCTREFQDFLIDALMNMGKKYLYVKDNSVMVTRDAEEAA